MGLAGWLNLFNKEAIILAIPGILAGALLVFIARNVESDMALPLAMVCLPAGFYSLLFIMGSNMEEAREHGWVGEAAPPVPVTDLFSLIDITKVHWGLVEKCLSTWLGMVGGDFCQVIVICALFAYHAWILIIAFYRFSLFLSARVSM